MSAENTRTRTCAVLSFHKIGAPPEGGWVTWNYVSESTFRRQLQTLRDEDFQVIDLQSFLAAMAGPESLPERTALLTFDDGYRSMLDVAEPILGEFGFPSVLFVPTNHIGGVNRWDHGNEPEEPICDWDELAELSRRGVSIQSHAVTHRAFSSLDTRDLDGEIRRSKERLEDRLDVDVDTLAFPYGDNGGDVDATEASLRDAGYRAAFLYKGGVLGLPPEAPYRLTRVPMGPDTDLVSWLRGERR